VDIDLSTDAPASPERTLQLAETLAEIARVLNHTTMDHGALEFPSEADRVLREYVTVVERMPQFLSQLARWAGLEGAAGRIEVPSGEWAGRPHPAVMALQARLDAARASAATLCADLEYAAQVTSALAAPDPEEDSDG
jgi:hypothetical protein